MVESSSFAVGVAQPLRFTVHAPDGSMVTRFETVHDKQLHLIVVRTDLTGYQHLHPSLGSDGVWSTPPTLPAPGSSFSADGVVVTMDGAVRAGGTVPLLVRTSAGPLERYLGAFGHLVVVRADDLSYVHVHPEEQLYRGAARFWVTVPGPG